MRPGRGEVESPQKKPANAPPHNNQVGNGGAKNFEEEEAEDHEEEDEEEDDELVDNRNNVITQSELFRSYSDQNQLYVNNSN